MASSTTLTRWDIITHSDESNHFTEGTQITSHEITYIHDVSNEKSIIRLLRGGEIYFDDLIFGILDNGIFHYVE